jgi:hypothetical protein
VVPQSAISPVGTANNTTPFVNDPDVAVAVCSLTAAGVGLNLQVASIIMLAELSGTDAEHATRCSCPAGSWGPVRSPP